MRSNVWPSITGCMTRNTTAVVGIAFNRLITNVAKELAALNTRHLVLPALLWIYSVAFGTFCAPLNVDVRIFFIAQILLNHLLRNLERLLKFLNLNALRAKALLVMLGAFSFDTTWPTHVSETLGALQLSTQNRLVFWTLSVKNVHSNWYTTLLIYAFSRAVLKIELI